MESHPASAAGRLHVRRVPAQPPTRDRAGAHLPLAIPRLHEATRALVRTERFVELATALAPKLTKEHWHYGPEVERFLCEHDPDRSEAHSGPLERHSGPRLAPWYEVTLHGKLLYRGSDERQAKVVQSRNPGSLKVGSLYG